MLNIQQVYILQIPIYERKKHPHHLNAKIFFPEDIANSRKSYTFATAIEKATGCDNMVR